jgi:hypothetical protein
MHPKFTFLPFEYTHNGVNSTPAGSKNGIKKYNTILKGPEFGDLYSFLII